MITNKKHNRIIKELTEQYAEELTEARNLKDILQKMSSMTINGTGYSVSCGNWNTEIVLDDKIAQYVDYILGGKLIKQEGIKCIVIEADGSVKTGLTKQKRDTGFTYKLIRK